MRTIAFSISMPCALSASTTSTLLTEPKRRPSTPAFCVIRTLRPSSFSATACAALGPAAGPGLRGIEPRAGRRFELAALGFDRFEILGRRALRLALRNQKIARKAVLHL